jgi:F0F1-type ATP synthase membrane subunit b/b'
VANLSVRVARQVIRGKLDEEQHEQLADDFIDRLKKSHASRKG